MLGRDDSTPSRPATTPRRQYVVNVPPEIVTGDRAGSPFNMAARVTRRQALSVPAVLRGRNLIAGTLATLPVKLHGPDRAVRDWPLFDQPDPDVPVSVTMAQTYEDLFFEGVAWWQVLERRADGFPVAATYVPNSSVSPTAAPWTGTAGLVSPDLPYPENPYGVYIDGVFTPNRDVIRFDSPNPPFLVHAARAIRTCIALDAAAARFSDEPIAAGYFQPDAAGMDPFEDEDDPDAAVQEFLDQWAANRRRHAWGYIPPGLMLGNGSSFSPQELQLADARQHAVLELARAMGIDPEELGVAVTSRTYFNAEDRRLSRKTDTYGAYVSAVEDRLSMGDVSPRGSYARISFDGFLRADTITRLNAYQLGKPLGVYDNQRVAELEDLPDARVEAAVAEANGQTPAPAAPAGPMPANVRELPPRQEATS